MERISLWVCADDLNVLRKSINTVQKHTERCLRGPTLQRLRSIGVKCRIVPVQQWL